MATDCLGIVLAAGLGRRMGRAKALLTNDTGTPLLWLHAEAFLEMGCREVRIVVRPEFVGQLPPVPSPLMTFKTAATEHPAQSLRVALRGAEFNVAMITPVDRLPAKLGTLRQLLHTLHAAGLEATSPSYRGQGGHPVLVRRSALSPYLTDQVPDPLPPLRQVLGKLGPKRTRVAVEDPSVLDDWDTPDRLPADFGFVGKPRGH